jgi:hypothetical protein
LLIIVLITFFSFFFPVNSLLSAGSLKPSLPGIFKKVDDKALSLTAAVSPIFDLYSSNSNPTLVRLSSGRPNFMLVPEGVGVDSELYSV